METHTENDEFVVVNFTHHFGYKGTVSVHLKVNAEALREVDVPRSTPVWLVGRNEGLHVSSVRWWKPPLGYVPLSFLSKAVVEENDFYWVETKDRKKISPADRLAAAFRRLVSILPIGKNEKQADEEGGTIRTKSTLPAACGCALLALWFLFQFCFLLFLWCSSNGTPTVQPVPSTGVPPLAGHNDQDNDSPATFTTPTINEYESGEEGGLLALLKELNRKFDAEREQRTEERAELISKFDAQQSTVLEMQSKFERMQDENRAEMRRLQAANEEEVANLTTTARSTAGANRRPTPKARLKAAFR
ncbi:hypothetical protein M3Y99_00513900 [Aphelenchoides fujianensis]|nr:hypothetical protein M3Y99_00513900 [Aphelenchoides fujianensis]